MDDDREMPRDFTKMSHPQRMETLWRAVSNPQDGLRMAGDVLRLIDHERLDVVAYVERMQGRDAAGRSEPDVAKPPAPIDAIQKEAAQAIKTLADLIGHYRARDPRYERLRYRTRRFYNNNIDRILKTYGNLKLADIKVPEIEGFYREWSEDGKKKPMGHSMVTMLRIIFNYGATALEDPECFRLAVMLRNMHFRPPRERTERMTRDHVAQIVAKAHTHGRDSLALAQAFQFECPVRQIDVIGEWVPQSEPGISDVTHQDQKWMRGLCWNWIDANLILRLSQGTKEIEVNLRKCEFVMQELRRLEKLPTSGPIIVDEDTGKPYDQHKFRGLWRTIANAAGVPKDVKNMDSPGGKGQPKAKPSPTTATG